MHYTFGLNNSSQCLGRGQLTPSPRGENSANYQWDGSLKQVMDCSVPTRNLCGMSVSVHTVGLLIIASLNSILSAFKNPESQGLGQWQDTGGHTKVLSTSNNQHETKCLCDLCCIPTGQPRYSKRYRGCFQVGSVYASELCAHMCACMAWVGVSEPCVLLIWVQLAEKNLEEKACVKNSVCRAKAWQLRFSRQKQSDGFVSQDPILVWQDLPLWSIFLEKHLGPLLHKC